jgi:hypothetical protein
MRDLADEPYWDRTSDPLLKRLLGAVHHAVRPHPSVATMRVLAVVRE